VTFPAFDARIYVARGPPPTPFLPNLHRIEALLTVHILSLHSIQHLITSCRNTIPLTLTTRDATPCVPITIAITVIITITAGKSSVGTTAPIFDFSTSISFYSCSYCIVVANPTSPITMEYTDSAMIIDGRTTDGTLD
jgi:hypothetical protein